MLDFVVANKEWLFSGIGVAILVGIIRFAWKYWNDGESLPEGNASRESSNSNSDRSPEIQNSVFNSDKTRPRSTNPRKDDPAHEEKYDVKRLYQVCKLDIGDYVSLNLDDYYKVRVEAKEIATIDVSDFESGKNRNAVHLEVNSGGGLFYGGYETERVGTNEFLVPRVRDKSYEEKRAVYRFHNTEASTTYTSITVSHINKVGKEVEIRATLLRARKRE